MTQLLAIIATVAKISSESSDSTSTSIIGYVITVIVIGFIIFIQIKLFKKNNLRMTEFRQIFQGNNSLECRTDDGGNVIGIWGKGNSTFIEIVTSINGYLRNNKGSVIDFDLLKDAVDRHCDSLEEDISAQTPIPLYCGLVGTMLGVIIGLVPAFMSKDFTTHTNELLIGVAMAMSASVVGIILTTINTMSFKQCKLEKERGENEFVVWMQANLLPKLSQDASKAFDKMVRNLNRFNENFAQNSRDLKANLREVNESYAIVGDIIDNIQKIDIVKVSEANLVILHELTNCTQKLEKFNSYINDLNLFTEKVQIYIDQFGRFEVIENIAKFFKEEIHAIEQRKGEIAKQVGDVDLYLKNSLQQISDTAHKNSEELLFSLRKQCDKFNDLVSEQEQMFADTANKMQIMFEQQIKQMPQAAKVMQTLPDKIDKMAEKVESSNNKLAIAIEKLSNSASPKVGRNILVNIAAFMVSIASILIILDLIIRYFNPYLFY